MTPSNFPRSDNRPAFLYWAGRAHERLGHAEIAKARYELVRADYQNSYYGRLAMPRAAGIDAVAAGAKVGSRAPLRGSGLEAEVAAAPEGARTAAEPATPSMPSASTEALIKLLLSLQLYDAAMNELAYVQRSLGDSPAIQATFAWTYNQRGDLRRGINTMKRAYPQYIAAGGERLPDDVLKVLFPLDYWDLIRQHSAAQGLDPYLVAALIAQESTFLPLVRSSANAWGLMQVVPSTGRRIARSLNIKGFSTGMLTDPETNVRIGTTHFAALSGKLGGVHLALASYNAGENRVAKWVAEKPDLDRDEFIDAIPFPETQNYVKRILGTVEDYRKLYGDARMVPDAGRPGPSTSISKPKAPLKKTAVRKPPASKRTAPAKKP